MSAKFEIIAQKISIKVSFIDSDSVGPWYVIIIHLMYGTKGNSFVFPRFLRLGKHQDLRANKTTSGKCLNFCRLEPWASISATHSTPVVSFGRFSQSSLEPALVTYHALPLPVLQATTAKLRKGVREYLAFREKWVIFFHVCLFFLNVWAQDTHTSSEFVCLLEI